MKRLMWSLGALALVLPPASVIGVALWARALSRRRRAPRLAAGVAYLLAAIGGLVLILGWISSVVAVGPAAAGGDSGTSAKAGALAEGISEIMNCGALALLVALGGAAWLTLWTWWDRRNARR